MKRLLHISTLFIAIVLVASCSSDSGGPNPEVTGIQPTSGPPGASVTISGKGFRPKGAMSVSFGGTSATLISATEDQIQTEVPESLSEGSVPVEVTVEGKTASGPGFTVEAKAPGITSVVPDSGTVGTEVTIKGMNFSSTASEVSITFDGTSATVKGAAQDQLITEVPQGATDGPIEVTVKQKSTTSPPFDVITDGTMEVMTETTGSDLDSNGYQLSLDGASSSSVGINDTVYVNDLEAGSYDLELTDIAGNCNINGSNPKTEDITAGDTTSATFSIDCLPLANNRIVFEDDRDGLPEIFSIKPDGTDLDKLTDFAGLNKGPVAISKDGTKIAFTSNRGGDFNIYIMNADGSNVQQLTSSSGFTVQPTWSPDGTKLAFIDDKSGNREIYVINVDGTGEQQLTDNTSEDAQPSWSPDGAKIIFASRRDRANLEIYTMDPDGSNPMRITNNSSADSFPRWSPDGSKIVFASTLNSVDYNIYTMDADGNNIQQLTDNSEQDQWPSWSPDGSEIVFESDIDGDYDIYKMNADGSGNPVNVTDNSFESRYPFWSPVE